MREIRFRAWHKEEQRYLPIMEIDAFNCYVRTYDDKYRAPEIELEQFTGLYDKNGKEIYEGDIVNCSEGCPHKIIWVQEHGGMFFGGMPGWYLSGLKDGYAWGEDEELIGNIHENKELLEVVDE